MSKVVHIASSACSKAIGPYVHATKVGNQIWVSGNIGVDKSGKFASDKVDGQAKQCLANIKSIVETAGSDMDHVVKCTIYLVNMGDYGAVNKVYATFFKSPNFPARVCVAVKALPKNALIEIDAIAVTKK